jgi:general stress protein YciG
MQRGNTSMNVHRDDEMKKEMQGRLRSGHATRAEEWNDPEPDADDDPEVTHRAVPTRGGADATEAQDEELRSDLARHLGRHAFPGDRSDLRHALEEAHAPDALLSEVDALPEGGRYRNVQEVMTALGRKPQS